MSVSIAELMSVLETVINREDFYELHKNMHFLFLPSEVKSVPSADLSEAKRKEVIITLYNQARVSYESACTNKDKTAIFYKLSEKDVLKGPFIKASFELEEKFKAWVKTLAEPPSEDDIRDFFGRESQQNIKPLKDLAHHFSEMPNFRFIKLKTREENEISAWFKEKGEQINKQPSMIEELSYQIFFNMTQSEYRAATKNGIIYAPGKHHNWGVNLCWSIGTSINCSQVNILSLLTAEHSLRTTPTKEGNPSAFALEIATAVKLGYGLKIDENKVSLSPPQEFEQIRLRKEKIPTMEEQLLIYEQCVLARNLHDLIKKSPNELKEKINHLCTNEKKSEQKKLLQTLVLLLKGDSLTPILNTLDLQGLGAIENILKQDRSSDYFGLKIAIQDRILKKNKETEIQELKTSSHSPQGATPQYNTSTQSHESTISSGIVTSKELDATRTEEFLFQLYAELAKIEFQVDDDTLTYDHQNEKTTVIKVSCSTNAEMEDVRKIMQNLGFLEDAEASKRKR